MQHAKRLALCHYWVAFAVFLPAIVLGAWQMLMRSPLPAPFDDAAAYYASVTLHGAAMAYVVTTFFTMGFGYAIATTSLGQPLRGTAAAFAQGMRQNDINQQMRTIAKQLTPAEMHAIALHYGTDGTARTAKR